MWYKVNKIRVGTQQVRPVWTPWSNTLAYFPFKDDQLDKVWSSSISITWTKQTLWYNFSSSWEILVQTPPSTCSFASWWVKYNSAQTTVAQFWWTYIWWIKYNFTHSTANYNKRFEIWLWGQSYNVSSEQNTTTWQRYHIAMWYDWTYAYWYINWQQVWKLSSWHSENWTIRLWYWINMDVSEYILESQARTAQEVTDYYNQTKSNYWL